MKELIESQGPEFPVNIPNAHVVVRGSSKFLAIPAKDHPSLYQWTCIRRRNPHALNVENPDVAGVSATPVSMTRCAEIKEAAEAASTVQKGLRGVLSTLRSLFMQEENIFRDMEPQPNYAGPNSETLKPVLAEKDPYLVVPLGNAPVTEEQVHTLFPRHDAEQAGNAWLVFGKQ